MESIDVHLLRALKIRLSYHDPEPEGCDTYARLLDRCIARAQNCTQSKPAPLSDPSLLEVGK